MVMIRSFGKELLIYLLAFFWIFFYILIESSADKRRLDNNSPTKSVVRNKTHLEHGKTLIKKKEHLNLLNMIYFNKIYLQCLQEVPV